MALPSRNSIQTLFDGVVVGNLKSMSLDVSRSSYASGKMGPKRIKGTLEFEHYDRHGLLDSVFESRVVDDSIAQSIVNGAEFDVEFVGTNSNGAATTCSMEGVVLGQRSPDGSIPFWAKTVTPWR